MKGVVPSSAANTSVPASMVSVMPSLTNTPPEMYHFLSEVRVLLEVIGVVTT